MRLSIPAVQQAFCLHPAKHLQVFTEWDPKLWAEYGRAEAKIIRRTCTCRNCGKIWKA